MLLTVLVITLIFGTALILFIGACTLTLLLILFNKLLPGTKLTLLLEILFIFFPWIMLTLLILLIKLFCGIIPLFKLGFLIGVLILATKFLFVIKPFLISIGFIVPLILWLFCTLLIWFILVKVLFI